MFCITCLGLKLYFKVIVSFFIFNICIDFSLDDCFNYCQNWTFVLCDNLGGCELCCDFQKWLEFIMGICLAFKISVSLLTWWGIAFELLYAIYFSNSGHPQSLISSVHLLFTTLIPDTIFLCCQVNIYYQNSKC